MLLGNDDKNASLEAGKLYPISFVLSYNTLSREHKSFSIQISAEKEPQTYTEASKIKQ